MTSSSILILREPPFHLLTCTPPRTVSLHLPGLATRPVHSPPLSCSSPMDFFLRHVDPRKWRALKPSPRSSPTHPIPAATPRLAYPPPTDTSHKDSHTLSQTRALYIFSAHGTKKALHAPCRGGGSSGGAMTRFPRRAAREEHEENVSYLPARPAPTCVWLSLLGCFSKTTTNKLVV